MGNVFDQYFTYWSDLPADSGRTTFGTEHLLWLAGIAAAIVLCAIISRSWDARRKDRFLKILAVILLAMEGYREIVLTATGHMAVRTLPLHLCGLAVFIEALFAFFPVAFFGELTCIAVLPAAMAALACPDWLRYPTVNYMNLHGFLSHGILVLFAVLVLLWGKYVPRIRRIYMLGLFFAVAAPILYRINLRVGSNFMFLNCPSEGSPLEGIYSVYGYGAYLAVFGAVVAGIILAMYGILGLIRYVKSKGKRMQKSP
ncbi:MAG: YwaF family protein [Clostridiales bacterium]|nr:YwaF family protein [Clostridiales bacterium]